MTDSVFDTALEKRFTDSAEAVAVTSVDTLLIRDNETGFIFKLPVSVLTNAVNAAAPVQSVAGKTGNVALNKSDVGLSNVDNTSDSTKNAAVTTLTNKTADALVLTGITDLQGGRLKFPATAVLSSDPNTLDDYEEGTFTPTYAPETGAFGSITVAGSCRYVKIGKTFFYWIDTRTTAATTLGTAGGKLFITGLPFNADANGGYGAVSIFQAFNLGTVFTSIGALNEANGSRIYLTKNSSNSGVAYLQATELSTAAGSFGNLLGIFGQYQTAS